MILATIRQLPAIFAPPGEFFFPRTHTGIAGGGAISLFVWAGLVVVRFVGCLLTGKVVFPTTWRRSGD